MGPACLLRADEPVSYDVIPASARWDVSLGHHRARVEVSQAAPAVQVHLPWRLPLGGMETHALLVRDPAGKPVENVVRTQVSRESADLVFQAAVPGEYAIYYLPFQPNWGWGGCYTHYIPFQETAEAGWRQQHRLSADLLPAGEWRKLPAAKLISFQARSEFDRFDPMEVIATKAETEALVARYPESLLLFPEDRRFQIRMRRDLPQRWAASGPRAAFAGEAARNEYYAFQIGVYAPRAAVRKLTVAAAALRGPGGAEIAASAVTCFNLQGVDTWGKPFAKVVDVAAGAVQPLWFGVDVARDQRSGVYTGAVTVAAEGVMPQTVSIAITVTGSVLEDRGDGDLWRMARLRWLNSTAGLEDSLIEPFTPLTVNGDTIACLGRTVRLDASGLPAEIAAGRQAVLSEPARFVVEGAAGAVPFKPGGVTITQKSDARVAWESKAVADAVSLACRGEIEFDGHLRYFVTLKADAELDLKDVRLELPYRPESAGYLMGIGTWGGARPATYDWKWQGPYDSFWLGDVHAGLWCELRGGTYNGPMLNLYHPAPPPTWGNGGRGGVSVREAGGRVLATAFSGPRSLKAGEAVTFEFALLVTPVKPLDTATQFKTRYWHYCPPEGDRRARERDDAADPTPEALEAGANVVNLHQGYPRNPYINYPFCSNRLISDFAAQMHAKGVKVKLYYTLRELSNYVAELWALRSLGDEVIANGGGGGFAWLQEHLGTGYIPSWYSPFDDGSADASFVNSGESRWYNYYVEGLGWMVRNLGIDGLYLDDVSYDRHVLQRMRRIMEREKPGCLLDLHSNTGFSIGPANQYLEFFPYIDRLWFGESFNYNGMTPDQWLVQTAGIPFGLMGEMLQGGGNQWRGALYGMTTRLKWQTGGVFCDPRNVWKVWDQFGITNSTMVGYWEPECPVRTDASNVLATAYVKEGSALVAVASWAPEKRRVRLNIDWKKLGLNPAKARLHAPRAEGFQSAAELAPADEIPVAPGRGWMFILDEKPPAPDAGDPFAARKPLLADDFAKAPEASGWTPKVSLQPGTSLQIRDGALVIAAAANHTAYIERSLPDGVTAIECRIDTGTDQGETWGPGLALVWADGTTLVFNVRSREQRFGIYQHGEQRFCGSAPRGMEQVIRVRLTGTEIALERNEEGLGWETLGTVPRTAFPGSPRTVRLGKMSGDGDGTDYTTPGVAGEARIRAVRIW